MPESAKDELVVGRDWIGETLRMVPFVEWDRFTTGEWSEDSPYVTVYGWLPRDQAGYKDFVILLLWPESETVYFSTSSAERTEDIFEALYDDSLENHNECQRVEDTFDVDNAVSIRTDGGEELESGTFRIAEDLDEYMHKLERVADRIDDAEMEDHVRQAIWRLGVVAEWDREENGRTPTDALAEMVRD